MTTRTLPRLPLPALALGLGLLSLTGLLLHLGSTDNPAAPVPAAASAAAGVPASAVKPIAVTALPDARAELQLGNPVVSMNAERGLLEAQVAVAVRLPGQGPVTGTASVTGQPRLDAGSERFYLDAPTLVAASLMPLPETDRVRVDNALRAALTEFFRQRAVFAPLEKGTPEVEPLRMPIP